MRYRLWPLFCSVGALLLAATPLLATDNTQTETIAATGTTTGRYVGPVTGPTSPLPATPAGDDDMPDRTTPRRAPTDNTALPSSVGTVAGEGCEPASFWTGWRQYWFRIFTLWFR